jgi:hypothetical protein
MKGRAFEIIYWQFTICIKVIKTFYIINTINIGIENFYSV